MSGQKKKPPRAVVRLHSTCCHHCNRYAFKGSSGEPLRRKVSLFKRLIDIRSHLPCSDRTGELLQEAWTMSSYHDVASCAHLSLFSFLLSYKPTPMCCASALHEQSTRRRRSIYTVTTMSTGEVCQNLLPYKNAGCLAMNRWARIRALILIAIVRYDSDAMNSSSQHNYTIISALIGLVSCGVKAASHAQPIYKLLQLPIWVSRRCKSSELKSPSSFGGVHDPQPKSNPPRLGYAAQHRCKNTPNYLCYTTIEFGFVTFWPDPSSVVSLLRLPDVAALAILWLWARVTRRPLLGLQSWHLATPLLRKGVFIEEARRIIPALVKKNSSTFILLSSSLINTSATHPAPLMLFGSDIPGAPTC